MFCGIYLGKFGTGQDSNRSALPPLKTWWRGGFDAAEDRSRRAHGRRRRGVEGDTTLVTEESDGPLLYVDGGHPVLDAVYRVVAQFARKGP